LWRQSAAVQTRDCVKSPRRQSVANLSASSIPCITLSDGAHLDFAPFTAYFLRNAV
jgi:hypothetical protein